MKCPDPNCNEGIAGPDDQRCARCDGEGFVRAPDGAQDECEACYEVRRQEARHSTAPFVDHARTAGHAKPPACEWCGHVHDPEDGRCDAHAHVGIGRCPCPGVERLHDAEAHLWALLVWFGGTYSDPYIARDLAAAEAYAAEHLREADMTVRHRTLMARSKAV